MTYQTSAAATPRRLLPGSKVYGRDGITTLSRTSVWRRVSDGSFPQPVKLGGTVRRAWFEDEVMAWIERCAAARGGE